MGVEGQAVNIAVKEDGLISSMARVVSARIGNASSRVASLDVKAGSRAALSRSSFGGLNSPR